MAYSGAFDEIVSGPKQPSGVLVYQTHRGGVNHHGQGGELRLLANPAQYVETGFLGEVQVEEDERGQRMLATVGERTVAGEVIYGLGAVHSNVDRIRQARAREGNAKENDVGCCTRSRPSVVGARSCRMPVGKGNGWTINGRAPHWEKGMPRVRLRSQQVRILAASAEPPPQFDARTSWTTSRKVLLPLHS